MKYQNLAPLATASALMALYLSYAATFVASDLLRGATGLELFIFLFQLLKIAGVMSVKRLRGTSLVNVVDLLGAELLVLLPGLAFAGTFSGVQSAQSLATQVLLAWIAGAASFGALYGVYRLALAMVRGERLVVVLPSAIFLSELLVLLVAGASSASAAGQGLPALSVGMIQAGTGAAVSGARAAGSIALFPLAVLYVSLLLYALDPAGSGAYVQPRGLAAVALPAASVTYAAAYVASQSALPMTYLSVPSTLLTFSVVWWIARGT